MVTVSQSIKALLLLLAMYAYMHAEVGYWNKRAQKLCCSSVALFLYTLSYRDTQVRVLQFS